jgi:hypothetical protein
LFAQEALAFGQLLDFGFGVEVDVRKACELVAQAHELGGPVAVLAGVPGLDLGTLLRRRWVLRELRGEHAQLSVDLGQT